jgi:hypothetical protein
VSDERVIRERWIKEDLEGSDHGLILTYYPSSCLEGLMKTIKKDSLSPDQDSNPGPSQYMAGHSTLFPLITQVLKQSPNSPILTRVYCNNMQAVQMVSVGVKINIFCWNGGNLHDHMVSQSRESEQTNMYVLLSTFNNGKWWITALRYVKSGLIFTNILH